MTLQRKIFAFLVVALMFWVTMPLLTPIAMGAVLAVLVFPLLDWLEKRRIKTSAAAGLLTLVVTILVLLPSTALLFAVAKSGIQQLQEWRETSGSARNWGQVIVNSHVVSQVIQWVSGVIPVSKAQILSSAVEAARSIGLKATELLGDLMARIPGATMAILMMILSMYFFLMDGRRLVMFIRRNSVFSTAQTARLTGVMGGICRSVILASLVSGAVQSVVEMLFCLVVGVDDVFLIGGLVFIASFVPLVGSAPVTLTVAAQQFLMGRNTAGVVLLIAAVVVGFFDNFIRPMVLRGAANLHPLLAFVAAFGGLQTIGVLGIFLGPIVAALFVETIVLLFEDEGEASIQKSG